MSGRASTIAREWVRLFVMLAVLHVVVFAGWIVLDPSNGRSPVGVIVLMIAYLVALAVILITATSRIGRAVRPEEFRQALADGDPATARVIAVEPTRWRTRSNLSFRLRARPPRREYSMTVLVMPATAPAYEARIASFLAGIRVPDVGEMIDVKIHPERPEIVVIIQPATT